ncbi:MAG TPA: SH3 domain-containing protein [Caulobacteraceae bacterium]
MARLLAAPVVASLCAAALAGCGGHASEGTDCPAAQRNTPSGFCVPRWVSLKHGEVMARKGPGKDYPALWVYHVDGLPVQVVAETEEWRRICGPDGGAAWVNRSEIDGRRTLLNQAPEATPIRQAPKDGAKVVGLLNSQALAKIRRCSPGWCQIRVGGLQGWMAVDQVWGVDEARQCK